MKALVEHRTPKNRKEHFYEIRISINPQNHDGNVERRIYLLNLNLVSSISYFWKELKDFLLRTWQKSSTLRHQNKITQWRIKFEEIKLCIKNFSCYLRIPEKNELEIFIMRNPRIWLQSWIFSF